jgi:DNA polymerase-3 subunit alpha
MRPKKMATIAKQMGMPAIALTDHGTLSGIPEFFKECKDAGIKPILGLEAYVVPNLNEKKPFKSPSGRKVMSGFHITLLAKNLVGFKNLVRLNNIAYQKGFYFRPKIDMAALVQHHEGLIVLSGCMASEFSDFLLAGQVDGAVQLARQFMAVFGQDYFIEIMDNQMKKDDQRLLLPKSIEVAKALHIPVVPTNDSHYVLEKHKGYHDLMIKLSRSQYQRKVKKGAEQEDVQGYDGIYHVKQYEEMIKVFGDCTNNTLAVVDRIENFDIFDKTIHLPNPVNNAHQILAMIAKAGLKERGLDGKPEYEQRLARELGVVERLGFSNYFLTTLEIIEIIRKADCPVGWGRGSGGGSLICYCLRITDVDPIKFGLLFERFISDDRPDYPDIDIDIPQTRRDEIIEKIKQHFGAQNVAHISTANTFKPKVIIRDVCREYNINQKTADLWSSLVPDIFESYEESIANTQLEVELAKTQDGQFILDAFKELLGAQRHLGVHASGIVISDRAIVDNLPVRREILPGGAEGRLLTQYTMNFLDKFGFLKFDILGLKTLDVIYETAKEVGVDIKNIPLDDTKVYDMIGAGQVEGMFQLDRSKTCAELCKQVKPKNIMELSTVLALHRPGVMGSDQYNLYIKRRNRMEEVRFIHPEVKAILQDTYGIPVFQEDLMRIAVILGGYTPTESENLRKGVGKKDMTIVRKHLETFTQRARALGKISDEQIKQIVQQIEAAGQYSFNKSHAVVYGYVSYACGWLSAHHAVSFFGKLISLADDEEERTKYLSAAIDRGIKLFPPDINRSQRGLTVERDGLRMGLLSVKGIGEITAKEIIAGRPYKDIVQVLNAVNRSVYSVLYAVGALKHISGVANHPPAVIVDAADVLGIGTQEMREAYADVVKIVHAVPFREIAGEARSAVVKIADITPYTDKNSKKMAFLKLIDVHGPQSEAVMFQEAFKAYPPEKNKVYHAVIARTGRGSLQVSVLIDAEVVRKMHALTGGR